MTVKELSRLYWLNKDVAADEERLKSLKDERQRMQEKLWELRESMDNGLLESPVIFDMPRAPGVGMKVENAVMRVCAYEDKLKAISSTINDVEMLIASRRMTAVMERKRLEEYISEIENPKMRVLMRLRFVDGQSWQDAATGAGYDPENSGESARRVCYRFLKTGKVNEN